MCGLAEHRRFTVGVGGAVDCIELGLKCCWDGAGNIRIGSFEVDEAFGAGDPDDLSHRVVDDLRIFVIYVLAATTTMKTVQPFLIVALPFGLLVARFLGDYLGPAGVHVTTILQDGVMGAVGIAV